jgi:hypothetical protein
MAALEEEFMTIRMIASLAHLILGTAIFVTVHSPASCMALSGPGQNDGATGQDAQSALPPAAIAPGVTGNWWGPFSNSHIGNGHLWGPILVSNGSILQTKLGFDTNECFFSGKITSGSVSGSKIKVNIHIDDNFSSTAFMRLNGTVSGNTMSGPLTVGRTFCSFAASSGTWRMNRVAKLAGRWSGWTKKSGTSATHPLRVSLSQTTNVGPLSRFNPFVTGSPTLISSSVFQVKGQFRSSSSGCVSDAAVAASGAMAGGIGGLQVNFGTNAAAGLRFYGNLAGVGATKITGTYRLASGACKGETGTFTLTRM